MAFHLFKFGLLAQKIKIVYYKKSYDNIQDSIASIWVDSDNSSKNINEWVVTVLSSLRDELAKIAELNNEGNLTKMLIFLKLTVLYRD